MAGTNHGVSPGEGGLWLCEGMSILARNPTIVGRQSVSASTSHGLRRWYQWPTSPAAKLQTTSTWLARMFEEFKLTGGICHLWSAPYLCWTQHQASQTTTRQWSFSSGYRCSQLSLLDQGIHNGCCDAQSWGTTLANDFVAHNMTTLQLLRYLRVCTIVY